MQNTPLCQSRHSRPERHLTSARDHAARLSKQGRGTEPGRQPPAHARGPCCQSPQPRMKPDRPECCVLLLMLTAAMLTRTRAGPTSRPLGEPRAPRRCHVARFQSLSPQELQAFKRAKDAMEESGLLKTHSCKSSLFPRPWDLRQVQVWERPEALQAELALTLRVLGQVCAPALGDVLEQPLRTLRHLHSWLRACAPAPPTAGPRPRSGLLAHWLHRLQDAQDQESPGCLRASVTFNLFRLLTRDLRCVARGDLCV